MKANEIFELLKNVEYKKSGNDVDWAVRVDTQKKTVMLLFQQLHGKTDWKTNFDFPVKPYKKQQNILWLHRGWAKAWKSCNDEVMAALISAVKAYPDYGVMICGWSYGGAMSLIAAEDFHFRTGVKPCVVTFGAPKPLWGRRTREYVASCCAVTLQYSHANDIVCSMPPLPLYRRVGTKRLGKFNFFKWLFGAGKWHQCYGDEVAYA